MILKVSSSSKETGALLKTYLEKLGIKFDGREPTVCYGLSDGKGLNHNCSTSKMERLVMMREAGVPTIPWWDGTGRMPEHMTFPMLARKSYGFGGKDLVPVFQLDEIEWRKQAGWDWFSSYVPIKQEFRVWVFRYSCLDIYKKVMRRPQDFKGIGRNFGNGFDFVHVPVQEVYRGDSIITAAINAVEALKLDFGAVDMIQGYDCDPYILEVNTAPGVIKSGAEKTLWKLAEKIQDTCK